jgi:hypothetical protein
VFQPATLIERIPGLQALFRSAQPSLAVEITEEHVAMARVGRSSTSPDVGSFLVAELPAGAIKPSAAHPNIAAAKDVEQAVRAARDRVAPGGGPIALCLPDSLARVALIPADTLPRRRDGLRELVAWRMKKTLPFRMDEAQVDTQVFPTREGKHLVMAIVMRRKVLAEYEGLLEAQGFTVGTVTLSTLALAELLPSDPGGDVMLVNVGSGWFSLLITNGAEPLFYRCKNLPESEKRGAERDWFVTGEIFPTLEYYRNRLGGTGLKRVFLHVTGPGREALRDTLATSVDVPLESPLALTESGVPAEAADRLGGAVALAFRASRREGPRATAPIQAPARSAGSAS